MQCPRCQQDNPPHAKFCLECGASFKGVHESGAPAASHADLQRALTEALDRETATSEILRVISQSPAEVQPVFEAIVRSGAAICHAPDVIILIADSGSLRIVASVGPVAASVRQSQVLQGGGLPLTRGSVSGRAFIDRRTVHVHDVGAMPDDDFPEGKMLQREYGGHGTTLAVPLLREDVSLGVITLLRNEVSPFTERQVALLQTFADQAVIAIENVRLLTELQDKNRALTDAHAQMSEALEQQTATTEILRVISSSPTDLQPVLDTVVKSAARFCGADDAELFRLDGGLKLAAHHGPLRVPSGLLIPIVRGTVGGRSVLDRRAVHTPDVQAEPEEFPEGSAFAREFGHRTTLAVPLLREGEAIGTIQLRRLEVNPFTDKQVELLQTFADQAVIAIENVRLFTELQASNRDLTTALDKQTATSDILRVLSRSQADVQPVFDTILASAVRLLGAHSGGLTQIAVDQIVLVALTSMDDAANAAMRAVFPQPLQSAGPHAQGIRDRVPLNIADVHTDPRVPEAQRASARVRGFQSWVVVPMLRHDKPIGAIGVTRREPGGFTDDEITLLQTFADQAVIAIENVRLFTELQASNRELTTALDTQTATSDILRVISRSQTDVQPVFDAIMASAARLLRAHSGALTRIVDSRIGLAAMTTSEPSAEEALRANFPMSLDSGTAHALTLRTRAPLNVIDTDTDPRLIEAGRRTARARGYRSQLVVPMLRQDEAIGTISLTRREPGGFTDDEIALLQTFADQAVIAIENVRLFNETKEALEQQTATSEILGVISRSLTEVEPVFDAVVASAARLCEAHDVALLLIEGDDLRLAAGVGPLYMSIPSDFRIRLTRGSAATRAVIDRATVHIHDFAAEPDEEYPVGRELARRFGHRTMLAVPLLRERTPIGVICAFRLEVRPFPEQQIALLRTFADQAVIAIENVRLFKELEARTAALTRSVEQLTALGDVGRAVSSSLDLETVLNTIVARAVQLAGAHSGTIWEYDVAAEEFVLRITRNVEDPELRANPNARVRRGEGAVGRLAVSQRPVQIPDITPQGAYEGRLRDSLVGAGTRALLAIPLLHEDQLLGGLVISRRTPGEFPAEVVDLLASFATQSALALQNARLFLEIEDKSRQLEAASQHKSEFLANMSHELRTPLNAIIGFSEVLTERMFGELNEKQEEYLKDIHTSGQHLLSLINDILDLSKIEAGRMELELADFHLPQAIENALVLVRERALRRGITLEQSIDPRLGEIQGDERKIKQVLLNLLSNAIKFTPEGGRVGVRAVPVDEHVEVAVNDTGVGIAPEDLEAVFEEFRQVGAAEMKAEGTGLGLALARKFIELHGGQIWVESQVGAGSTFTFTIPIRKGG